MAIENIKVNAGTETPVAFDQVGTVYEQVIKIDTSADGAGAATLWDGKVAVTAGTIDSLPNIPGGSIVVTSLPNLPQGSIQVTAGTVTATVGTVPGVGTLSNIGSLGVLNAGTLTTIPNIPGGTVGLVTRVSTIGTLEVGTISSMPNVTLAGGTVQNIVGGTVTRVSTLGTLEVGTISSIPNTPGGTLGLVTTVSNVSNGSIVVTAGTIATGTIVNSGTTTGVGTVSNIGSLGVLNAGTITKLEGGTVGLVTRVGNVGTLEVGTVVISGGTINAGTVTTTVQVGTIDTGTLALVTRVGNVGTLEVGTISTMPNIPGGTLGLVTTVTNLSNGTIQSSGTTTGVGVVSMLSAGTISMLNAGTITTIPNTPGGTLGLVTTVSNLTNGSVRMTVGTLTSGSLTNLGQLYNAGTVQNQLGGTITTVSNVLNAGTNSARNTETVLTYGTTFAATAAAYGTLVSSAAVGVGTSIYVQNFNAINPAGTVTCLLGFGTVLNGTSVLFKGVLGTQTVGGIQKSWDKPVSAGMTNQDLVLYLSGAGTVDAVVSYFIKV